MSTNKDYSKQVKIELLKRDWTYKDLASEVSRKTGMFCDQSYLSRILAGERTPEKLISAINSILDLGEQKGA